MSTTSKTPNTAPQGAKPAPGTAPAAEPAKNLKTLAQTLEFAWFATHVEIVLNTILLIFFRKWTKAATLLYRLTFVSALAGFGIIIKQKYAGVRPTSRQLLADDNVQYFALSLLWLVTKRKFLSPFPFAIFSLFHILTYTRSFLLPALGHSSTSKYAQLIEQFVKKNNDGFTKLAAYIEIAILLQVLLQLLTFRKGTFIVFAGYATFFRLRYAVSGYTRNAVKTLEVQLDNLLGHPSLPPAAKESWLKFKNALASIPGPTSGTAAHPKAQ